MESRPQRSIAPLVAGLVITLMVVAAIAVLMNPGTTATTSETTSSIAILQGTTTSVTTNDSSGLRLILGLSNSVISQGSGITIEISLYNTLTTWNTPAATGHSTLSTGPCPGLVPYGVGIFEGDYSAGNLSDAQPLGLYYPGAYSCPGLMVGTSFSFAPMSDNMSIDSPPLTETHTATENGTTSVSYITTNSTYAEPAAASLEYTGYWTGEAYLPSVNATFQSFAPGTYTVEGVDWWGHMTIVHFQVVDDENPLDCVSIASNPSYLAESSFDAGAGPLSLTAYYKELGSNDTYMLALSNIGGTAVTVSDVDQGFNTGHMPLQFTTIVGEPETWQYFTSAGTPASPATLAPGQCSLIRIALQESSTDVPLTLWFSDNSNQTLTLDPSA